LLYSRVTRLPCGRADAGLTSYTTIVKRSGLSRMPNVRPVVAPVLG
jgi:hypothetical protein